MDRESAESGQARRYAINRAANVTFQLGNPDGKSLPDDTFDALFAECRVAASRRAARALEEMCGLKPVNVWVREEDGTLIEFTHFVAQQETMCC